MTTRGMSRVVAGVITVLVLVRSVWGGQGTDRHEYDVVVYGGTSAGVAAAVSAARQGVSVAIVCPEDHLGGLTTNGLGWTDSGDKSVIGGISREFYQRIKAWYDEPGAWRWDERDRFRGYRADEDAMWVFEPRVAERVFNTMIDEAGVPVFFGRWLDREGGVEKGGLRIVSVRMLSGEVFAGRVFIDATYEGDLLAAAGVSYVVGREGNAVYGETLNGVQAANAHKHQFEIKVDPYVEEGEPASGLLPRVHDGSPGAEGEGDGRVQAYTYRLCMTREPENRVAFARPEGYDAGEYTLLLRYLRLKPDAVLGKFDPMPNSKTDTNNNGAFSTDNIGMNYDYPEASYAKRKEILAEHEWYQRGLFYFLQNDPRLPESVRERVGAWGLAADEFVENGNWPRQIYVRESRRMVGELVMTERRLRGEQPVPRPIGAGSYNMDSHNVQRYVAHDETGRAYVRNEGDVQVNPGGPYPIGYGAIVPKHEECDNLLVPVCVSSSHIAYGSIRMEPVFMVLGESAATAAVLAVEEGIAVQSVDYAELRARLLAGGQVLDVGGRHTRRGIDPAGLGGIVIDDTVAQRRGVWEESASVPRFVGRGYLHDRNEGKGESEVRFAAEPEAGRYRVCLAYTAHENRAANVPVRVEVGGVERAARKIDQRRAALIDGVWAEIGEVVVVESDRVEVSVQNAGTDGYVVADAVWLVRVGDR